jgi:hypothetical protein
MDEINVDVIVSNGTNVEVNSPSTSVNAFVNLPPPLSPTITSPTYDTQACVVLPQGPIGPIGPSGAIGPSGIPNTGELDLRYVNLTGNQTISGIKTFATEIIAPNLVYNTGDQNISGNKSFYGDILLSGANNRIGKNHYISTDPDFVFIIDQANNIIFSTEEYTLFDSSGVQSITWGARTLNDSVGQYALDWDNRNLTNKNGSPVLYWTGNNIGIGTNTPSEKLQVIGNINISGTGIFNALDLNNVDVLSLSGIDITITSGAVALTNRPTVNGTGVLLSGEAASLPSTIVYTTGDQNISGNKTFINNIEIQGTGIFNALDLSNISEFNFSGTDINLVNGNVYISGGTAYISGNPVLTGVNLTPYALANQVVYTTGNQTINGLKIFTSGIDIYSGINPQSLRIFNSTGTNSGEFGLIGWRDNQLVIGSQQSQSGILRDVLITGNNININGSGALNIFDNTNISGNLNVTGNILLSGKSVLTGIAGTGNFVSFNDLNKDYQKIYISNTFGNNLTAQIGNKFRPYASLQYVWDNLISPNSSPRYVLNIDSSTSTYQVSIDKNWPSTVFIEQTSPPASTISIISRSNVFGSPAYDIDITDLSDKKLSLLINLTATAYAGGLGNNGGNGGNVNLKNCLVQTINSIGADAAGGSSFNGGNGGNIRLIGCEVMNAVNTIGGFNALGVPSTIRGGGNVYVENTKFTATNNTVIFIGTNGSTNTSMGSIQAINSTLGANQSSLVGIARASNNPTISLNGCLYYNIGFFLGGNGLVDIKNSTNLTRGESILSSYYSGSANLFYNNLSVRNNNLSGILNDLTLHDNQNRLHTNGSSNTLTIDFASGVNFSNKKIFGFVPDMVEVTGNFLISGNLNSDVIIADSPSQITGILVSGNPNGFNTSIIQRGAGQVRITGSGVGIIINSYNNQYRTAGQFASVSLLHTGNNIYMMYGNTAL